MSIKIRRVRQNEQVSELIMQAKKVNSEKNKKNKKGEKEKEREMERLLSKRRSR